jgi:alcohol dehydrogenase class IV
VNFEFATATRIVFGPGKRTELFDAASAFGSSGMLVTGENPHRARWLVDGLKARGIGLEIFTMPGEPTLERVEEGRRRARSCSVEFVIAVGGGSAIDGGKAIAALATNDREIAHYLEIIGGAKPLTAGPLPFIAIPTTAGTGAEVTRNAVLRSPEHQLKVSLRSPRMLPAVAIVDPELTYDLPARLTASTGMDALTQLIEPFLCARPNPLVDALCREAIPRVARALPVVYREPDDRKARSDMALGSLFGGLALANAGLGAVHGFAAPIGGMVVAPHGAVCAALLAPVLEINYAALKRDGVDERVRRFVELGSLLTQHHASAEEGINFLRSLSAALAIPPLRTYGVKREDIPLLCSRAGQASSMKANPVELSTAELATILERAL